MHLLSTGVGYLLFKVVNASNNLFVGITITTKNVHFFMRTRFLSHNAHNCALNLEFN